MYRKNNTVRNVVAALLFGTAIIGFVLFLLAQRAKNEAFALKIVKECLGTSSLSATPDWSGAHIDANCTRGVSNLKALLPKKDLNFYKST